MGRFGLQHDRKCAKNTWSHSQVENTLARGFYQAQKIRNCLLYSMQAQKNERKAYV